jgi:FAD/FMN-containing dehydrogenase
MHSALVADLERIVGAAHVFDDPADRAPFETDWTGRWHGEAAAVVRPADVDEVAAVVRACRAARAGIVPQGGNTGLVGGGVPRDGAILLSLGRLGDLGPVDGVASDAIAGAGATIGALQRHAAAAGLAYGVDFAARDSATVGGTIATNAGGVHVIRYGMTRDQLLGIEAVLGDGSIVRRLDAPRKDNTGYHLASLLAGSEGTLGVVTAARLRLVPRLERRAVAVVAAASVDAAVGLAARVRRAVPTLAAAELFLDDGLELVIRHGATRPFAGRHAAYLLLEAADTGDPEPALVDALAAEDGIDDAAIATDSAARDRLWALREGHTEAIGREGVPHKIDVALPVGRIATFIARLPGAVDPIAPGARTFVYGHVLDGNLHVNVLGPDPADDGADDAVLSLALELGGTISAEHGIGIAKVRWLARDRAPGDVAAMRAIKRALDPDGIMNPGVLFAD